MKKQIIAGLVVFLLFYIISNALRLEYNDKPNVKRVNTANEALAESRMKRSDYRKWVLSAYREEDRRYVVSLIEKYSEPRALRKNLQILSHVSGELPDLIPRLVVKWEGVKWEYEVYLLSPEMTRDL